MILFFIVHYLFFIVLLPLHLYNLIIENDYNRPAKRFSGAHRSAKKVVGGIFDIDARINFDAW